MSFLPTLTKGVLFTTLLGGTLYGYNKYKKYLSRRNLWVESDFEPDDVLAMDILKIRGYNITHVVVGEGDVKNKMYRAMLYFTEKSKKSPVLISGNESNKDFPEPYQMPENKINLNKDKKYVEELKKYLQDNDTIFVVKPPRELYNLYLSDKDAFKKLFKDKTCYMYGSFNLRSLKASSSLMNDFLKSFGNLYLYESYYATEKSNVNVSNYENFNKLNKCHMFFETMGHWDNYLLVDCIDTCQKLKYMEQDEKYSENKKHKFYEEEELTDLSEYDRKSYMRNKKAYMEIFANCGQQFVFADVGLALGMKNPNVKWKLADISVNPNTGYTQITDLPDSSTDTSVNKQYIIEKRNLVDYLKELSDLYVDSKNEVLE
jgi:hypothetical protein